MRLVTEEVLAIIDAPDPGGEGIDPAAEPEPEAALAPQAYLTLTGWPDLLIQCGSSPESVFYSRYYWFCRYDALGTAVSGRDVGLEQQAYQILEYPHPDCEPNWCELERVEALAGYTEGGQHS
jgi:hypothetical protein